MDWLTIFANLANRIPLERVLFPPRDNIKALERFAATMTAPQMAKEAPLEKEPTPTFTPEPETVVKEAVATACVPCALGHFSTTTGLLVEAVRFKAEGITSNEVLDRIAKALQEQNTLERVDLTPEKIRSTPDWERDIAEEALQQSRSLRHRLETIKTIEELEAAAADTEGYYRRLNREWWKRRFAKIGKADPEASLEEAKKEAAEEGNPSRVRFDRADINSAIEAAKRLKSDRDLYIFATYLGYTIDRSPPPGMQSYAIVHPDGTVETIKPGGES